METIEYTTIDKTTWGAGPWTDEPDKRQWTDPATGIPCLIVRSCTTGSLCGYAGVAEGHPLFGKSASDVDLSCHGGLTFASMCDPSEDAEHGICHIPGAGEPDHVWWLGFDAGHAWDQSPALEALLRKIGSGYRNGVYRDMAYMVGEVTGLAAQLKELS